MKLFVTAVGDDDVGIPGRTFAVAIDDLPEDAVFCDDDTRQEARSTMAAAFAILLGVPCYVTFESDPPEEPDDDWTDTELAGERDYEGDV